MKYAIMDQTVEMWLEKDTSPHGPGFTVCRPEQLELVWDDCDAAEAVRAAWQAELGPGHNLEVREVQLPTAADRRDCRRLGGSDDGPEFPANVTWEMLETFLPTKEGSTRPCVGMIDGRKYIVKYDCCTNYEHVMNELFADEFVRTSGFNAPPSRTYFVPTDGTHVNSHIRLALYLDGCVALDEAHLYFPYWNREIKRQVVAAYPMVALMANVDAFHNDNVLVDREGRIWFVDNGASFGFRARGERKERSTGFAYDWLSRCDCGAKPKLGGLMGIYAYSDQLKRLLGCFTETDVLRAAWEWMDPVELVRSLPDDYRTESLLAYAQSLARAMAETVGGKGGHDRAWKYPWKFYDGGGTCPFDHEKDPTAALFWRIESLIERIDGREQVVEWLFETTAPESWPQFMREARATRDELAVVLYAYETERRLRYATPGSRVMRNNFGVEAPVIDWKRYFER